MSVNVSECQPQAVVVCQREEQTFPLKEAGMITIKANTLDRGVPSWEAVRRCRARPDERQAADADSNLSCIIRPGL